MLHHHGLLLCAWLAQFAGLSPQVTGRPPVGASRRPVQIGPAASVGSSSPILVVPGGCADSLRDRDKPGACIAVSTTPTLGLLHPLSADLFVAVDGAVGIGTTSPAARLDVAGNVRVNGVLTLSTTGDTALDVGTGSIDMAGAPFIHAKGGPENAALGRGAMGRVTTGVSNTAGGARALTSNTVGDYNTAFGFRALYSNTSGTRNTALGLGALASNTDSTFNVACGSLALYSNTSGSANTACGPWSLYENTTGNGNVAVGRYAGFNLTTGDDNIVIGNAGVAGEARTTRIGTPVLQTRAFIAGIRGVTTGMADAIPVVVDGAGQLGTISSSRRFKKDIADMGDATERLLELRPVVFRHVREEEGSASVAAPLEYGLVAEEVAEVFPDLVVLDEQGRPATVKYHLLSSMLLNELEKLDERVDAQAERLREIEAWIREPACEHGACCVRQGSR